MSASLLREAKRWAVRRISLGYVVGPALADALQACRALAARGVATTICPWNGAADTAESVARSYREAVAAIAREQLPCYVSIKLPALEYRFSLLSELLVEARDSGVRLHFDAMDFSSAELTLRALERARSIHPALGATLPARWGRSRSDAVRLAGLGVPVRVVKGQWRDPTWEPKDLGGAFLDLVEMLAGRGVHVSVASHDASLALRALELLAHSHTSHDLELLYGLPMRLLDEARRRAVTTRVYVPYGTACIPYGLSLIRKRPIVAWWIARDLALAQRFRA